jgi:farnesyl-diphosphate farnesyltransferase
MSANDNVALQAAVPPGDVEVWSGKDKQDENFPVASVLIRQALRGHVHAFYNFARNGDDIADSEELAPADKVARLDVMEAVLLGKRDVGSPTALALRASLAVSGVSPVHAQELLVAFRQDAVQNRYANFAALLDYCRHSAAPVGRYVLDLHGEAQTTWPASDALCAALQINNHLQDAAVDLRRLDRCYLPQDFMAAAGANVDDLARPAMSPGLRQVYDRILAETTKLNAAGAKLPGQVAARRLRVETGIIATLAKNLTAKLQQNDPLAGRVKLQKRDFITALLTNLPRFM